MLLVLLFLARDSSGPRTIRTWNAGLGTPENSSEYAAYTPPARPVTVPKPPEQLVVPPAGGVDVALPVVNERPANTKTASPAAKRSDETFDWDSFIAALGSKRSNSATTTAFITDYFVPSGAPAAIVERSSVQTPEQQTLHEYGNALGSVLSGFEKTHPNMPNTLQAQAEDPTNPAKRIALQSLADEFTAMARDVAAVSAPPQAQTATQKLSSAYRAMGETLRTVPEASTDQERIDAMLAYNSAAEQYITAFLSIFDLFGAYDVRFTSSEPGSVFSFSYGSQ